MNKIALLVSFLFSSFIFASIDIAGGNHVMEGKWKVIKNIEINDLTIRHLRQIKGKKYKIDLEEAKLLNKEE